MQTTHYVLTTFCFCKTKFHFAGEFQWFLIILAFGFHEQFEVEISKWNQPAGIPPIDKRFIHLNRTNAAPGDSVRILAVHLLVSCAHVSALSFS